jgi:uncharacterized protein DUF5916
MFRLVHKSVWVLLLAAIVSMTLGGSAATVHASEPLTRLAHVKVGPRLGDFIAGQVPEGYLRIDTFLQREPGDGLPATRGTTAYLAYDDNNLYAIFLCREDAQTIRAHMSRREDLSGDDLVSVTLDTFHDGRRAYEFFSNPLGVQKDAIISEGQADNFDFDAVYRTEGRLTKDGFAVLFAIPFKSLRFTASPQGTWGIALTRFMPARQELVTWPHLSERIEAYVPQFAAMSAISDARSGHNLQLSPYVFFSRQRFLDTARTVPSFMNQTEVRGGIDAKFSLADSFTFDFTANPDFSQVESDEPQVTIDQRYEVFFPEKRPFFTDRAGFFQTPENLFFTRRIADPQFGTRMTGQAGGWVMGVLAMDDRAPGRLVDTGDPRRGDHASIGVARVQREFGQGSNAGFFLSRRSFGADSNTVFSFDARLKLNANWTLTAQAMRSRSMGFIRENGNAYFSELRFTGRHLSYYTRYRDRSPGFRTDLGFIPRVDIRQVKNYVGYRWRSEHRALVSFGPAASITTDWNYAGQMQDWIVDVPFAMEFRGPTSLTVGHLQQFERFAGLPFRENASYAYLATDFLRWLGVNASYVSGTNINFFPAPGLLPFLGRSQDATLGLKVRPNSRMAIEETYIYSRLGSFSHRSVAGSTSVFNDHLLRTKINYQLSKRFSARAIFDYNATLSNPSLIDLERTKRFTGDFLLTYLVSPGTAIYAGYSNNYENLALDALSANGLSRTRSPLLSTGRQFFIKINYLLRF